MGDAQSAQRDGTSEAAAEEQSAVQDGPSGESTHDKLIQNNGQISDVNGKRDGTTPEVKDHCEDKITKAITVNDKVTSVPKSEPEEITNVKIIQEQDANEEEPIEIINVDAKQNDLNESFRKFFSNIGLKLTVKRGVAEEENEVEKLDVAEKTDSNTKYEDVEQNTDLNAIQDNDSTTCPTLTDGTPEDVVEMMTETKENADNTKVQEGNDQDGNQSKDAMLDESPNQEDEVVSPIKKFFTTGIFAGLAKKKKEEELDDKELLDISKNEAIQGQEEIGEASPNVAEQDFECKAVQAEEVQAMEAPEEDIRCKSPSTDQDSEHELSSSQEKAQSSPFKRLFSGSFKRRSKRQKRRKSSDAKLSDSVEQIENKFVESSEKTEEQDKPEETPSPPPPTTEPEEELSAWEAFKKLMTPKKSFKRVSEETQVPTATVEETKLSEGDRISDRSTEEGRKRKDSSHSWEAVLCGSGRRRSRKTSDSEDEQKENGERVESPNEAEDVVTSTPKQAGSPSDSESSTWKSFKKLMTPKRKVKEDEESKDNAQSDGEAPQEETLFSLRKLLPSRKKKQDQLSSDEGEKEAVSMDEDSETPAVVPLSEFDQSETEETAKTDTEIKECKLDSEQEHILEIPKTFVQEIQEHQVTQIIALNQEQDELTEFSKYQPLSDIPEEGNITETVATSLIEEVVKDDTIAEDMVEITSEAITAPEPVDITMADETDELMLSAASHLPESSKTSGNATPVPAEYDVKDTDVLLNEVVEMISTATKVDTVCSEEPVLLSVIGSVTHETLERSVSKEQNAVQIHDQSEVVAIETGLQVDQLQDTDVDIPATALSESLSEFKDAISTEFVSELSKVEFESAMVDVDEVQIARAERAVKQESVDDSEYMIESLSEVPESTEMVLQDINQDVLPTECLEGEANATRTESIQPLLDEKVEAIEKLEAEKTEIEHQLELELPKAEVDPTLEICKEDDGVHKDEAVVESNAQINQPDQLVQSESEERIDLQSLEGAAELVKDVTPEEETSEVKKTQEKSVEVETVVEDFEIVSKQDVHDAQEPTLDSQILPEIEIEEIAMQKEESIPLTSLEVKEYITEDIETEHAENDIIGNSDQNEEEEHISETSEAVHEEEVPATQATTEQDGTKVPVSGIQEIALSEMDDATKMLTEETDEDKLTVGTVPLEDEAIMEQKVEETAREIAPQDGDVEEQPLSEATAGEIGDKIEEEETNEDQEPEILPQVTGVQNGQAIASPAAERKVIFNLDHALEINGEHTEAKPSTAQVMYVDHSHEVAEDLEALSAVQVSSINEDSGISQVLEDTVNLEKSCELFLSTSEEPIYEVHIGETEVNVEEQLQEEIPSAVTELANVECATLPEESVATSQQVTPTMPDLVILKTVEHSERISEETSIPCVDNAESLDEPKHEVQLSEVKLVGIQGEKEEEIVPPVLSNANLQYAFVTQTTSCSFKDVVSGIPNVSVETTTEVHEPMVGIVASEQEYNESIEIAEPLEENHVTQEAQEGKTVVLMHVPSVKTEDNHQIQVQVVDVDIQTAETRVDTALEIGVLEDKEVINTCIEKVGKVDLLSANSETEQEIVSEKEHVAIQEVVQHVKELPPESEEEPKREELSRDFVDGKLSKAQEIIETQDEEDTVAAIRDSVIDTKDEVQTKIDEEGKEVDRAPTVEQQINTASNTVVAVPQNTGIISSYGNVEAPSSLSLEFKLNIQFGQSKAPILPSPPTTTERVHPPQSPTVHAERSEPPKPTEMTEVGVQAVDLESNQENVKQKSEIVMAEAAVQATDTVEKSDFIEPVEQGCSDTTNKGAVLQLVESEVVMEEVKTTEMSQNKNTLVDVGTQSTEIAKQVEEKTTEMEMSDDQPALIHVGIQSMQQEELSEKDKIPEVESPCMQTAEIVHPDKELMKNEVVFTELVVFENPIKQTEDEDENQDVWMDAEEDIVGREQITMPLCEIEESFESQPDYFQETKSDFEDSFDNIKRTTQKCDSEEEDFAAALEDPQISSTISTMEWD